MSDRALVTALVVGEWNRAMAVVYARALALVVSAAALLVTLLGARRSVGAA